VVFQISSTRLTEARNGRVDARCIDLFKVLFSAPFYMGQHVMNDTCKLCLSNSNKVAAQCGSMMRVDDAPSQQVIQWLLFLTY
jgi:hypothetical protein